jgi:hypothetical protein
MLHKRLQIQCGRCSVKLELFMQADVLGRRQAGAALFPFFGLVEKLVKHVLQVLFLQASINGTRWGDSWQDFGRTLQFPIRSLMWQSRQDVSTAITVHLSSAGRERWYCHYTVHLNIFKLVGHCRHRIGPKLLISKKVWVLLLIVSGAES